MVALRVAGRRGGVRRAAGVVAAARGDAPAGIGAVPGVDICRRQPGAAAGGHCADYRNGEHRHNGEHGNGCAGASGGFFDGGAVAAADDGDDSGVFGNRGGTAAPGGRPSDNDCRTAAHCSRDVPAQRVGNQHSRTPADAGSAGVRHRVRAGDCADNAPGD